MAHDNNRDGMALSLAYHEIEEMTKRGVPGVWTHGFYDGWGANYMVTAAQGHNSIGRFYETHGGRGADTLERTVPESSTTRTWFRPNPPLAKVRWSLRNNVNLQQSALLLAMNYVARNKRLFLENFYLKSRRSVEKAVKEGPAAWVIPDQMGTRWTGADLWMADMLLDRQYFNVSDPRPYDDTGWSLGPLRNLSTVRLTDVAMLRQGMGGQIPHPA